MASNLKSMHLLQRLIERLNSEVYETSYMMIADVLLTNYHKLPKMTIKELCEKAFVSKSTVRRFCNNSGYQNFSEMKKSYVKIENDLIPIHYKEEIPALLVDMNREIISIKNLMLDHEKVFIFFPYDLYAPFYDFQRMMVGNGKLVYLMPNIDLHFEAIEQVENALIIVVDFDDEYVDNLYPYLNQMNAQKLLLTNKTKITYPYHQIITFKKVSNRRLIKYQLMMFLDQLENEFSRER